MDGSRDSGRVVGTSALPAEWLDLGLDREFPGLTPDSLLGQMAVDLTREVNSNAYGSDPLRRDESMAEAYELARERLGMFTSFYAFVDSELFNGDSPYATAVDTTRMELAEAIERNGLYSPDFRRGLRGLVNFLGTLYRLETGVHFQEEGK